MLIPARLSRSSASAEHGTISALAHTPLHDDRSGSATGPNSGDLVAMESMMSFPQVTLSEPQDYEASFVLNFGVP